MTVIIGISYQSQINYGIGKKNPHREVLQGLEVCFLVDLWSIGESNS